jgi:ureidoacrylate peracid hydrolase
VTDVFKVPLEAARRLTKVPLLATLAEKVDPKHTALLVIDMQNDFCARGGLVDRGGRDVSAVADMAPRLAQLIAGAREAAVLVIFVRCSYSTDTNAYLSDVWLEQAARRLGGGYTVTPVCQAGTWGGDYFSDVRPQPTDIIVVKHRYSAFHGTDLDLVLRANGVRTVVLTGVSTHVCVETSARDAFVRDFYTVTVRDGTAAYSAQEHEHALAILDRFFGQVVETVELQEIWSDGLLSV